MVFSHWLDYRTTNRSSLSVTDRLLSPTSVTPMLGFEDIPGTGESSEVNPSSSDLNIVSQKVTNSLARGNSRIEFRPRINNFEQTEAIA